MQYFILFLEGIITFISPCLLPMLPIYIFYLAGGNSAERRHKTVLNAMGFVLGFTLVFVSLGAFAGTVGGFFRAHTTVMNLLTGGIVILFGLNFLGLLRIPFLNASHSLQARVHQLGFFSSTLFGMVFSIGWTPCVGAFLGSALLLAGQRGKTIEGILLLLCYSAGLGVPFLLSAVLIERLKGFFDAMKRNYRALNTISGVFLIIIGLLMMTGLMGRFLALLTF